MHAQRKHSCHWKKKLKQNILKQLLSSRSVRMLNITYSFIHSFVCSRINSLMDRLIDLLIHSFSSLSPMDALFALQVLHACGHILRHPNQHFPLQILTFTAQEGQKVSPCQRTRHRHKVNEGRRGSSDRLLLCLWFSELTLTLDQLHDDVDGRLLCAHTN